MAETKKTNMVTIRLPRKSGQGVNQDEIYSHNFTNYMVRRGEDVEVPNALADVILDQQKAAEEAARYVEEVASKL